MSAIALNLSLNFLYWNEINSLYGENVCPYLSNALKDLTYIVHKYDYNIVLDIIKERIKDYLRNNRYVNDSLRNSLDDLINIWERLDSLSWLMHFGCRDHVIHSFNVLILGHLIISECTYIREKLSQIFQNINNIRHVWTYTSLLHDIGYVKFSSRIKGGGSLRGIAKTIHSRLHKNDDEYINFLKNSENRNLREKFTQYIKTIEDTEEKDDHLIHDFYGGQLLYYLYKNNQQHLQQDDIRRIIYSIAVHQRSPNLLHMLNINFDEKPLASLLIICDELQEWGRPGRLPNFYIEDIKCINNKLYIKINGILTYDSLNTLLEKIRIATANTELKIKIV